MDTLEAIRKRCSTRKFNGQPVPKKDLETLVDAGRQAPSARAVYDWEFIAATDKKALAELGKTCDNGRFLKDAGAAILVLYRDGKYYLEDGCAATENILLAATALQIGSCWVAGDKKPYVQNVLKQFGAPEGFKLVSIIALGYPMQTASGAKRRELSEVLHWEKF